MWECDSVVQRIEQSKDVIDEWKVGFNFSWVLNFLFSCLLFWKKKILVYVRVHGLCVCVCVPTLPQQVEI